MHGDDVVDGEVFAGDGLHEFGEVLGHEETAVAHFLDEVAAVEEAVLGEVDHHHSLAALGADRVDLEAVGEGADGGLF